jgi:cell division transport system permease protein
MTAAVIGIALALPAGLFVALANVQQISGGFDSAARITLFLRASVDDSQAAGIAKQLSTQKDIAKAHAVTRAQALEEFRQLSGFGAALDALEENPLPAVIVVQPADAGTPESVEALLERLRLMPQVELAQLDMQWVKRLYALLALGQRGILLIAALLGLSVLLIVGNTIRLDIQNHREEIEVTKLIGATDAFVRRPFLYSGFWYGLGGGLIAWLLVDGALSLLRGPVQQLAGLYGSGFTLSTLGAGSTLQLLALSTALGLLGSWLAVGRHLDAIQPS